MKKPFLLIVLIVLAICACSNNEERKEKQVLNQALVNIADEQNKSFPQQKGAFVYEKAIYSNEDFTYKVRVNRNDYAVDNPEDSKWLGSILINDLHTFDQAMVTELIKEGKSLRFEFFADKDTKPCKIVALTATQMKKRIDYLKTLNSEE